MKAQTFTFSMPLRTTHGTNNREHHFARARRVKQERTVTAYAFPRLAKKKIPAIVKLVRVSAGEMDDDGVRGALKAVRDEIARQLGVDDSDPRVDWLYGQKPCPPKVCGVEVTIETGPGLHVRATCTDPNCPLHWRPS